MKKTLKNLFGMIGYEIRNIKKYNKIETLSNRPVGSMDFFLYDMKERGLECNYILDVGANRTIWSRLASSVFDNVVFYLIEPQIEMEPLLSKFITEHLGSKYFLNGAGSVEGEMTLTIWPDLNGSSLIPDENEVLIHSGKQRKIDIITINSLIKSKEIKIPDIIKIDIQGFELEALKGADLTFGVTELFIIEVSLFDFSNNKKMPIINEIVNFMSDKGYGIYDFAGFLRRPLDGALGQIDVCFVKNDGRFRNNSNWS